MEDKYKLEDLSEETLRYMVEDLMTAMSATVTLRDQFAMQALNGILSISNIHADNDGDWVDPDRAAILAYSYADSLMKAREVQ